MAINQHDIYKVLIIYKTTMLSTNKTVNGNFKKNYHIDFIYYPKSEESVG